MVKKKNRDHLTVQQSNRWHCDFLGRIKTLCKSAGNSQSKNRENAVLFQSEVGDIAEGFNLALLDEISDEYNNPVRNISDLWSLLMKIEVTYETTSFEINEIPRTDISASELNGNDCAITFLSYLINLIFILNSTFLCNFILTLYVPKLDKGVSINIHFLSIS